MSTWLVSCLGGPEGGGVTDWYRSGLCSLWVISNTTDMGGCVGHTCILVVCVSLTLVFHVLVALQHIDHGCSKVIMRKLMSILWNASLGVYDLL